MLMSELGLDVGDWRHQPGGVTNEVLPRFIHQHFPPSVEVFTFHVPLDL